MHSRERILNLNSAENEGGGGGGGESMNGNLRGEMEKAEGDERRRGGKKWGKDRKRKAGETEWHGAGDRKEQARTK